jgi:hypothetical protein
LHEKLKIIAAREGVSLNAFVTSVLAEAVGKKSAVLALAEGARRATGAKARTETNPTAI